MDQPQAVRVYRVTVRGRFADMREAARQYLVDAIEEHSIFKSAFTSEGTFVYDEAIDFFSLRYEVRIPGGPEGSEDAASIGTREAEAFLATMGFGYRNLKVSVFDVSAVWDDSSGPPEHRGPSV